MAEVMAQGSQGQLAQDGAGGVWVLPGCAQLKGSQELYPIYSWVSEQGQGSCRGQQCWREG